MSVNAPYDLQVHDESAVDIKPTKNANIDALEQ